MTKQKIHKRISKKGKPFLAGTPKQTPVKKHTKTIHIQDIIIFKRAISPLRNFKQEITMHTKLASMIITEMCPANVAILDIHIADAIKTNYNELTHINVNIKQFYNSIKDIKTDKITYIDVEPTKIIIKVHDAATKEKISQTELPQKDIENEVNIDTAVIIDSERIQQDTNIISLKSEILKQAIKDLNKQGDTMTITSNEEGTFLKTKSDQENSINIKINKHKQPKKTAKYSLEYLKQVLPALHKGMSYLQWKTDSPLIMRNVEDKYTIRMILAPIVDNNN